MCGRTEVAIDVDSQVTNGVHRLIKSAGNWQRTIGTLRQLTSLRVHHITSVLSAFSWRRFQLIQLETLSTHCDTVDDSEATALGSKEPYIWLSSAYWCSNKPCSETIDSRSAV